MSAHTHDGIDWVERLADLRRADEANGPAQRAVADRLIESLPAPQPTVLDVGCGAGGMSAALAEALAGRAARSGDMADGRAAGGGTLVLVDAVPELLAAAAEAARSAAGVAGVVNVHAVRADLAAAGQPISTHTAGHAQAHAHSAAEAGNSRAAAHPDEHIHSAAQAGSAGDSPAGKRGASHVQAGAAAGSQGGSPAGGLGRADDAESGSAAGSQGGSPAGGLGPADDAEPGSAAGARGDSSDGGSPDGGSHVGDPSAGGALAELPAADLVWASNVAHHLPDQRTMVAALAAWLAPGGCFALAEGGLSMKCLPWDIGIGEPGLQDRLIAAHGTWFHRMRTEMPGTVRLPVGWNVVLEEAGLTGVTAFSYLVDVPAPLTDTGRAAVVSWLAWMARATGELLTPTDVATLERLLDPDDAAYVGNRDDIFLLKASTVYLGWRR
jgi:SAM-dependent methyltransferase